MVGRGNASRTMKRSETLVVTSINPFSRLGHQRRCVEGWQSIGMDVVSCNTHGEAELLKKKGFPASFIRPVADEHSGQALFGKPVPLIRPLLDALEKDQLYEGVVLANSDIFPAIRSSSITNYWAAHAPALALTREETHDLFSHDFDSESAYRGGLDIFFFQRDALAKINALLRKSPSSMRMAFGVPGWDFLLSACLLAPEVGGRIFDSHVMLHRTHKPTYGDMSEFAHYVPDLQRLGAVSNSAPSVAADEFAAVIERECRNQRKSSRAARLLYYHRPHREPGSTNESEEFDRCWADMMRLAERLCDSYRKRAAASLYQRMAHDRTVSLDTALSLFCNSKSALFQFNQALFAIVFSLKAGRSERVQSFKQTYPEGNQHAAALRNIMKRHDENDPLRRYWIARLFGSELVDHGIFNPRLYNYLVLASENDCELELTREIKSITWRMRRDAA